MSRFVRTDWLLALKLPDSGSMIDDGILQALLCHWEQNVHFTICRDRKLGAKLSPAFILRVSMLLSSSAYFLFDVGVIVTLLSFKVSDIVDSRIVYEHVLTSDGCFMCLCLLRILLFTAVKQLGTIKSRLLDTSISLLCLASISFSFFMMLLLSELKEPLFVSFCLAAWTILSSACFYLLWWNLNESGEEEKEEDGNDEIPLTRSEQIRVLLSLSFSHWKSLILATSISLLSVGVCVALPHYTSEVLNGVISLREDPNFYHSIKILAGLTVASVILAGLRGGSFLFHTSFVVSKMRKDLFASIMSQEIAFFDKYKSGEIVSRLTSDVDQISNQLTIIFTYYVKISLQLIGKIIFMSILSWKLTLVNFIAFPIMMYITKLYTDFYEKMGEEMSKSKAVSHQVAEEAISSIRTVRSFAAEKRCIENFDETIDQTELVARREALAITGQDITHDFFYNSIYVIVLIYGARLISIGALETSTLVTFMMYQLQIGDHIVSIANAIPEFAGTLGQSRKFCHFLVRQSKMRNEGSIEQPIKGELKLENISFSYPSRPTIQVLENFSLEVRPGETLALVGPSGAGKSTIVSLIERFYDPDDGEITLDGVPLKEYSHEYIHSKIALVAQEPVLFDCSVRENIRFGCDASEEQIITAAKTANAHTFIMGLAEGYETKCGEKGAQMSGGQKQRIAIARALVRDPSILILDEATSALDGQSEMVVQEAMERCSSARTVIVIAHRLSTIEKADRIAVIDGGRVVQLGTHTQLLQDENGLYHQLVRPTRNEKMDFID